jgi:hypothetical protein
LIALESEISPLRHPLLRRRSDRYAEAFAAIPHLDYLEVGWGGDIHLRDSTCPHTFFNIRLSPVEMIHKA